MHVASFQGLHRRQGEWDGRGGNHASSGCVHMSQVDFNMWSAKCNELNAGWLQDTPGKGCHPKS